MHLLVVESVYLPASHTEHDGAPAALYVPARQLTQDVALGSENFPAEHSEQLSAPFLLNLLPSHATHTPALLPL